MYIGIHEVSPERSVIVPAVARRGVWQYKQSLSVASGANSGARESQINEYNIEKMVLREESRRKFLQCKS